MNLVDKVSDNKYVGHWELVIPEEGARMGTFFSFLSVNSSPIFTHLGVKLNANSNVRIVIAYGGRASVCSDTSATGA
jgi:hypothetical protein